jgi:hypothetical protein
MSQQYINIGATPNDGLGDPIRTAFQKTNENFTELYANVANTISVTGNISANYFIGNGVYLTGISSGSANTGNVAFDNINIIGTGNLHLQPDANNAGAFLDVYLTTGPDIHIAGNGENLIIGRDDGANVTVGAFGNVTIQANNGTSQTWTFDTTGSLTTPGNVIVNGEVSATGNINSNYLFGNGTFLTGISGAGNPSANALTGNTLTANVTISSLTQLGTLGNLSVSGNTTSGNLLTSGLVSVTGNAQAGNILTTGVISSTGNAVHGNILTTGIVSATGNIIASNHIGNLSNGTSKISIASSGNVSVGVGPFTTVLNVNTSTGISVLGNVVASANVYSNGNIAMVSNLPRNTYVANVAPTSGDGNIGDIWYQTF